MDSDLEKATQKYPLPNVKSGWRQAPSASKYPKYSRFSFWQHNLALTLYCPVFSYYFPPGTANKEGYPSYRVMSKRSCLIHRPSPTEMK